MNSTNTSSKNPNNMKRITITILFLSLLVPSLKAQISLPSIIDSNMVLQRNTSVKLWGWAKKNEKIKITGSWFSQPIETKADKNGKWIATLLTTNSKEPQTIKISDSSSEIALTDILFGEVWLCSGQSNMERALSGGNAEPTFNGLGAIAKANNPNLRIFTIERAHSKTPKEEFGKVQSWASVNANNVADFSAVAYFFGSQLQEALDVPVGLIHSSWGGSDVRAWMSEEIVRTFEDLDLNKVELKDDWEARRVPTMLFNAMIHPIIPYTLKGTIWYQGESNRNEPERYQELFPAMVNDWRHRWSIGNFPFYYVQIAPYDYRNPNTYKNPENAAFIREAQLKSLDAIPNAGMAVTMDLGESFTIHPPKKKEVGDRLFYLAMNKTYGFKTIDYSGPVYASHEVKSDSLIITFKHAEKGLYSPKGLKSFEIAGEDQVFYPADASILNKKYVLVKSGKVSKPLAVRYGWSNWVDGSLFDTSLLPASSFRTDDWDDATQAANE
jgi:sialate O-acetylesterase